MTRKFMATPYLFLAPALALIAVFVLYPILAVLYYSFTDYNIINPPIWVGLDNYGKLLADPVFWKALTHSVIYLVVTPTIIAMSVALAIVVNRKLKGIHIFRALYYARDRRDFFRRAAKGHRFLGTEFRAGLDVDAEFFRRCFAFADRRLRLEAI